MRKSLLLLMSLFFLLTACPNSESEEGNGLNDESELPEVPETLTIRTSEDGGMLPVSHRAFISFDSAYWIYDRYNYETMIKWIPTKKEIDDLYSELRANNFDKIKSDCKGEVYDRGGQTIWIEVNGKSYEISNSGNCFIKEEHFKDYLSTSNAIAKYVRKNVKVQMIELPIEVSKNLIASDYHISIQINNNRDVFSPNIDTVSIDEFFYPGPNEFLVSLEFKDSTNYYGSPVNYKYDRFFETVDSNSKKIYLDWKNNEVILNVEN